MGKDRDRWKRNVSSLVLFSALTRGRGSGEPVSAHRWRREIQQRESRQTPLTPTSLLLLYLLLFSPTLGLLSPLFSPPPSTRFYCCHRRCYRCQLLSLRRQQSHFQQQTGCCHCGGFVVWEAVEATPKPASSAIKPSREKRVATSKQVQQQRSENAHEGGKFGTN